MIKRFLGVLLAIAIVLSMSLTAFCEISVSTDIKINTADNTYTLSVNAQDSDGSLLSYQWYECNESGGNPTVISGSTENTFIPPKSTETKYYYCTITAHNEEDGTTKTVNSKIAEVKDKSSESTSNEQNNSDNNVYSDNTVAQNQYTAPVQEKIYKEIYTFSVNNIDEPETGEAPDFGYTRSGEGYSISSVQWSPECTRFQPETKYTVTITVKLNDDCKTGENFRCLIDDKIATIGGNPSDGEFTFSYTFPATDSINEDENDELTNQENDLDDITTTEIDDESPLGIPGWLWFVLALILIVTIAAIYLSHRKKNRKSNNKTNKNNNNLLNKLSELLHNFISDDDDDNEPENNNKERESLKDLKKKAKADIKEGKIFNKYDSFEEYEADMNNKKYSSKTKTNLPKGIPEEKNEADDNNVSYFDSGSVYGFGIDGLNMADTDLSNHKDTKTDKDDKAEKE